MKRLLIFSTLLLVTSYSQAAVEKNQSVTFFGKVLKVDGHNVMHVAKDNSIHFINLAYMLTPVRGEPYFEETNKFLKETAENKWLMFTIASYGRNANVKPALIRLKNQKSLNAEVVRRGMGMVDLPTKPPPALIDQAMTASESKVGMWGLEKMLNPLDREVMVSHRKNLSLFLSDQNTSGIKPYILLDAKKLALPIACAFHIEYDSLALTAHAARHRGYKVEESCDLVTSSLKKIED